MQSIHDRFRYGEGGEGDVGYRDDSSGGSHQGYGHPYQGGRDFHGRPRRAQNNDEELYSRQFPIEHKMFYVDLKANANGVYLKISEKSGGRRHNVLIPGPGLEELLEAVREAVEVMNSRSPEEDLGE
jgi:hypothetical protein